MASEAYMGAGDLPMSAPTTMLASQPAAAQPPTSFGRYTLLSRIGYGGMAEVWKAKVHGAANFQRTVVIKRILPHLGSDQRFVDMFAAEARLSARLLHPHIVQVFDFGQVDGEYFLAMEYVPGVNLADALVKLPPEPLPLGMAVQVVRDVCLALGYAHGLMDEQGNSLGIIHRDVSPSNVMLGHDGSVKLLDFGIAKALARSPERSATGSLKGKLAYLSPEATEGESLDGRTDIFAAGVVLHELITGRRLFKADDDMRTLAQVRACRVPPPSQLRADVPAELDRICARALARERDERYATADEMGADLTRLLYELRWDAPQTAAHLRRHGLGASRTGESNVFVVTDERSETAATIAAMPEPTVRPRTWWPLLAAGVVILAVTAYVTARSDPPKPVARPAAVSPGRAPAPSAPAPATVAPSPPAATVKQASVEPPPRRSTTKPPRRKTTAPAKPAVNLRRGDLVSDF